MQQHMDPVCGMAVDRETAVAQTLHDGHMYYFCSVRCKHAFDANPTRYATESTAKHADSAESPERHEPPYTESGGWVAPKFGSAGSGGGEYELLPEAHDRDDRSP